MHDETWLAAVRRRAMSSVVPEPRRGLPVILRTRRNARDGQSSRDVAVLVLGGPGGLSGGDLHALRLAEAWSRRPDTTVSLIGDPGLREFADAPSLHHVEISTPFDSRLTDNSLWLMLGLLWRGVVAVPKCRNSRHVVASSHLIFDVAPASAAHWLFGCEISSFVYHIIGDMDRPRSVRSLAAKWLESVSLWLLNRSHAIRFTDNPEAMNGLVARGHPIASLFETGNAYDPSIDVPAHQPANPPRLVFVGRLVEQKGIMDVLAVARRLQASAPNWQIDIVGDGPERRNLIAAIQREQLDNVHLHGFVDEPTKWRLLSQATLFLAPSREEGWGIAVGEALLAGLPVVALRLPAYRHFPLPLQFTAGPGDAFADRVMELVEDEALIARLTSEIADGRSLLPSWADVVASDLAVLDPSAEQRPSSNP